MCTLEEKIVKIDKKCKIFTRMSKEKHTSENKIQIHSHRTKITEMLIGHGVSFKFNGNFIEIKRNLLTIEYRSPAEYLTGNK